MEATKERTEIKRKKAHYPCWRARAQRQGSRGINSEALRAALCRRRPCASGAREQSTLPYPSCGRSAGWVDVARPAADRGRRNIQPEQPDLALAADLFPNPSRHKAGVRFDRIDPSNPPPMLVPGPGRPARLRSPQGQRPRAPVAPAPRLDGLNRHPAMKAVGGVGREPEAATAPRKKRRRGTPPLSRASSPAR